MKTLFVISIFFLSTALYADWDNEQKLTTSDGTENDHFGNSVSIDGDYAVIGAIGDDNNGSGSAYIFHRSETTWIEQDKITASDGEPDDWFGKSVSISGDYAIIGAWQDDDNGDGSGSAYIYFNDGVFIEEEQMNTSVNTIIFDNYPNPFTTSTTIEYELPQPTTVQIIIYNHLGKQIEVIQQSQSAGKQQVVWNAEGLPSGVYFCVFKTDPAHAGQTLKMIKLK